MKYHLAIIYDQFIILIMPELSAVIKKLSPFIEVEAMELIVSLQ